MFLLKICLTSYQACSLKESGITRYEGENWEHWIDGQIENPDSADLNLNPGVTYDGVYNSIFLSNSQRSLVISNDPLGQRPLYYREVGEHLFVGSCFWDVMGAVPSEDLYGLNEDALESLLKLRRIVPAHHTLHREIFVLPAGSKLVKTDSSKLQLSHVIGMQQKPDEAISVHDAAVELKANMVRGLSRIKESGKYDWFWFGNSGGLDSRVIPALAEEVGLECKGFLVSGDRIRGLSNLSKLGSEKVAEKYGVENRFIDYTSSRCTKTQRIAADIFVNPFGPANYHKNPDNCDFLDSLIVNGGNSFIIANDNGSWKRYLDKGEGALKGYFSDILIRKSSQTGGLNQHVEALVRSELDNVVDLSDDFSVCRTLHQKYLNKTSPMGAFESMNWAGEFHYLYYSGESTLYRHWPKDIFFDRRVQKEFMGHFYPELMNIADQGGNRPNEKWKKTKLKTLLARIRGNGLNYGMWLRRRWFKELVSEVSKFEFLNASPRSRSILSKLGEFDAAQDNLDMVKLAIVTGMIEAGLLPKDIH